jgi:single-strand DNA-binding protein
MANIKLPQRQANVSLFGRLTRDAELKYSDDGKPTCGFSVAVERWTGKERVSWFADCRVFGKAAEKFAADAKKGSPVHIMGEPYLEEWTTKEGEKRKSFKVFVTEASVLEWPDDNDRPQQSRQQSAKPKWEPKPVDDDGSDLPF